MIWPRKLAPNALNQPFPHSYRGSSGFCKISKWALIKKSSGPQRPAYSLDHLPEFPGKLLLKRQGFVRQLQDQLRNHKSGLPVNRQIFPGGQAGKQVQFQVAHPTLKIFHFLVVLRQVAAI